MSVAEIIATLNPRTWAEIYPRRKLQSEKRIVFENLPQLKAVRKYWNISKPAMADFVCGCLREHAKIRYGVAGALKLLDKFDVLVCAGDYQKSSPIPSHF